MYDTSGYLGAYLATEQNRLYDTVGSLGTCLERVQNPRVLEPPGHAL
jgi:hypothetical protein